MPVASSPSMSSPTTAALRTRLHHSLWSFFAGDALASPTHWFYGGPMQVRQLYGGKLLDDYTKPCYNLPGSILNKSDPSGGGRSSNARPTKPSIIGDIILHDKLPLWDPSKQIHYHATLEAGENTLEVQIARVLMQSIVATKGRFDANHFRQAYIDFMTTPSTHNDTYASTCHRMFFANKVYGGKDPVDCPDNDGHNVDTIDGLILPTIVALSTVRRPETRERAVRECVAVTRNSMALQKASVAWSTVVVESITGGSLAQSCARMAQALGWSRPRPREGGLTACYLNSAVPAMLDHLVSFRSGGGVETVWKSLLSNANAGGENVHRGSCLGAVLGAAASTEKDWSSSRLVQGLKDFKTLQKEIDDFVDAIVNAEETEPSQEL